MTEQQSDYMQGFYRGRAEGVVVEQERIIKLIEACLCPSCKTTKDTSDCYFNGACAGDLYLIALIKGEIND